MPPASLGPKVRPTVASREGGSVTKGTVKSWWIVDYIANQEVHYQKLSFEDELRKLLLENALDFEERYLWD